MYRLEFFFPDLGDIQKVELDVKTAIVTIEWTDGTKMEAFVEADDPRGFFKFTNYSDEIKLELIPPRYESDNDSGDVDEVTGQDLRRLGYKQGEVVSTENQLSYHQT